MKDVSTNEASIDKGGNITGKNNIYPTGEPGTGGWILGRQEGEEEL